MPSVPHQLSLHLNRLSFCSQAILISLVALTLALTSHQTCADELASDPLRVMSWNIWHGGREDGEQIGPQRVIEVIQESRADIVAMQETYGSGELISKGLGFHFQSRGTNLSIHSRFPILEDISVFEAFKCTGALIELPSKRKIAFYCLWLPYGKDIWLPNVRDALPVVEWKEACLPSARDLNSIKLAIAKRLEGDKYKDVSIIIAGDFNSMSHLDYQEIALDQYKEVVNWDTSQILTDAGFRDSYREVNPKIDRTKDATWSPRFPEQEQDRIDFIYYRSDSLRANQSHVIREHAAKFPSDHGAIVTVFEATEVETTPSPFELSVASYNIRHGAGTDNVVDLARTAEVIRLLETDFIGVQEVDCNTKRSGNVNQMRELGEKLGLHAAFGKFMNYQAGQYGLGILSRYPIQAVEVIELPTGNEPRIALAIQVILPNDQIIEVVNVHFDWVRDDTFRFAQATQLKESLDNRRFPYLLVGDFNDQPKSRTLTLFKEKLLEANKSTDDRNTFPSTNPSIEIDYIFASPTSQWEILDTKTHDEPLTSDHRPVSAHFRFGPSKQSQSD